MRVYRNRNMHSWRHEAIIFQLLYGLIAIVSDTKIQEVISASLEQTLLMSQSRLIISIQNDSGR